MLNVNGPNAPVRRHRVGEWIKTKKNTHTYAAYKRLMSDLKTHKDGKWEDGKMYLM